MADDVAENLTKLKSVAEKAEDLTWRETERGEGKGGRSNPELL